MLPERWREVERLYHLALEHDPELRSDFLEEASGGDRELWEEVVSLLEQTGGDSRLERPVWQPGAAMELRESYRLEGLLGSGGMGEVFRAQDLRLKRTVAVKLSRERFAGRFKREARAAAALNHPNIIQTYELGSAGGYDYIVMEFVAGRTLAELIRDRRLRIDEVLVCAHQIALALAAAHAAGIVHRDIKPGNIIVNDSWAVKVLDFGLAKHENGALSTNMTSLASETATGATLGTPSYMSPEQAKGKPADARSDIFSFGAVLYEMLTGSRPFLADSTFGILTRVVNDGPTEIRKLRPEVPPAIIRVAERCLEKDPARRYSSGSELAQALVEADRPVRSAARVYFAGAIAAAMLIAAVALAIWFHLRNQHLRWAREEALPKIQALVVQSDYFGAFALTRTALRYDPDNAQLKQHWENVSLPLNMTTEPPGAKVSMRPFGTDDLPWQAVGTTPLARVPVPFANLRVRVEKEGMEAREFSAFTVLLQGQKISLYRMGTTPAGMLPVPEHAPPAGPVKVRRLPDFFLDKFEVTNRQFQRFVDSGGYRARTHWRYSFLRDGRELPWEQAMAEFRDTTGRPGPALWELGTLPKEQAEYPVAGVSWFEAAAYCQSVGKSLPTMYHWQKAAGFGLYSDILLFSNFTRRGPMRVGANPGITTFGAYDMAGNVKEWVLNQVGERRLILGGSFGEPGYPFEDLDARDPFARLPNFGFRCASFPAPVPSEAFLPFAPTERDYSTEKPVSDETFEIFRRMYAYDQTPVAAKTERIDDSNTLWRTERVSYAAAYGGERIPAYLFLPKNVKPPYQTVLFVPGGWAFLMRNSQTDLTTDTLDFLLRTGRAVLYPVYKGTFERQVNNLGSPNAWRENAIQCARDALRSVDYLETRKDIQATKIGYYGMSFGGTLGPVVFALDPRLKAGVLSAGSLYSEKVAPEIDILNFAPRVRTPVLMIGGRHDFVAPLATLQQPLFRLLGTGEADKRFVQADSGHVPALREVVRETLNWFDHYLGPVALNVVGER